MAIDGDVYSIDLSSGEEIWRASIGEDLPRNSSPAVTGERVLITTALGTIVCLEEATGSECWRAQAQNVSLSSSAVVVDETVYIVDTRYGVSAFSVADGSTRWSETLDLTGQANVAPIVLHGTLFIGTSIIVEDEQVATLWAFTGTNVGDADGGESTE
jgi:outer membrane protein assembly factor BamB